MMPVPEIITVLDVAFGNIEHLPKWEDIPDQFKKRDNTWTKFISKWFYSGIGKEEIESLKPKEGIEKGKALSAIKAILASWAPKHEHKEAGAAYLMSEWFESES